VSSNKAFSAWAENFRDAVVVGSGVTAHRNAAYAPSRTNSTHPDRSGINSIDSVLADKVEMCLDSPPQSRSINGIDAVRIV